jgi:hypothetical protein
MSDLIDEFVKDLCLAGVARRWELRGCWNWEIREVEKYFNIKLPAVYRSFLKRMGFKAGRLGIYAEMFYKDLEFNRRGMEYLLELDGNPFALTPTEFVFSSEQEGCIFHYFETSPLADDPPVYGYEEGEKRCRLVDRSFSAFLYRQLEISKRITEG